IDVTTAAPPGRPRRLLIAGSAGSLLLEGDHLVDPSSGSAPPSPKLENVSSPIVTHVSAHQRIIEDFVEAIRVGRPPPWDGTEGRRSVEVVEAVYRSSQEKRIIELPDP